MNNNDGSSNKKPPNRGRWFSYRNGRSNRSDQPSTSNTSYTNGSTSSLTNAPGVRKRSFSSTTPSCSTPPQPNGAASNGVSDATRQRNLRVSSARPSVVASVSVQPQLNRTVVNSVQPTRQKNFRCLNGRSSASSSVSAQNFLPRNASHSSHTTKQRSYRYSDSRQRGEFPDTHQKNQFQQNVRQNFNRNRSAGRRSSRDHRRGNGTSGNQLVGRGFPSPPPSPWRGNGDPESPPENQLIQNNLTVESPVPLALSSLAVRGPTEEESDIPGFAYDSATGKYYRIQNEASGPAIGYRHSDLLQVQRDRERVKTLQSLREKISSRARISPSTQFSKLLRNRELGFNKSLAFDALKGHVVETPLLRVRQEPDFVREILPGNLDNLIGCQYLDVAKSGRTLYGCWAVDNGMFLGNPRRGSRFMTMKVDCNKDVRRRNGMARDGVSIRDPSEAGNSFGLQFEVLPNIIHLPDSTFVDLVLAPYDTDVTCILSVTACDELRNGVPLTRCTALIEPVSELCSNEGHHYFESSIYNIKYRTNDEIWSCAWSSEKLRLSLGMRDVARIMDVLSETNFCVSSRGRNVLSQQFSLDGNMLYMGLRGADMICSDLRLRRDHVVRTFEDARTVGWIKFLEKHPYSLITDNFAGELKLWDTRTGRHLMTLSEHRNSHSRLPCFVDKNEHFIFAVGEDGVARGWSLRSGKLLCSLPSPRPTERSSEYSRVVYSDSWGGHVGNSAAILAVGGNLRVHELQL